MRSRPQLENTAIRSSKIAKYTPRCPIWNAITSVRGAGRAMASRFITLARVCSQPAGVCRAVQAVKFAVLLDTLWQWEVLTQKGNEFEVLRAASVVPVPDSVRSLMSKANDTSIALTVDDATRIE